MKSKKMENKEAKKIENLEDLRCGSCCYSRFYTDEPKEIPICRLYIENDDLSKFPINKEILRRKKAGERLEVCKYFLDRKTCPEALYARLQRIKKIEKNLEKMADDIVELQSKKSPATKPMIGEYKKRLEDLNEEVVDYNKFIKGTLPAPHKEK